MEGNGQEERLGIYGNHTVQYSFRDRIRQAMCSSGILAYHPKRSCIYLSGDLALQHIGAGGLGAFAEARGHECKGHGGYRAWW